MKTRTRPGRSARPSRPRIVAASQDSEPLDQFFAEIRDTPVLTAEQEQELGRTMREARAGMRDALARIPGCARRLVEAWERREAAGLVTTRLSELAGEEGAPARTKRALGRMRRLLKEEAAGDDRAPGRDALEKKLVAAFAEFEPQTPLMLGWVDELSRPSRRSGARTRREEGVRTAALSVQLAKATLHRDAYLDARAAFVRHNLRFVVHMAKDFRHLDLSFADLIQEGSVGLMRAVEKFDERKGFRFSTYASWWIYQAFIRSVQKDSRTVRLPSHLYDRFIQLRKVEDELQSRLGRAPSVPELAAALAINHDDVEDLLAARSPALSFEAPVREDGERSLGETLADTESDPLAAIDASVLGAKVGRLLHRLTARERRIVEARFGIGSWEPRTLQSIAQELGMSRERVRQIEKRALERMESAARKGGLEEYLETGTG